MKQLKYAIQNVIRGKGSNIVKVVSITLGLLVSVILIAKVAYELSYDNFYRDNEQLYVVKTGWDGGKHLSYCCCDCPALFRSSGKFYDSNRGLWEDVSWK